MADFTPQITGSQAVLDVSLTLGLPANLPIAESNNQRVRQLWLFANEVGKELAVDHDFSCLREEFSLTLDGSLIYDLPDDFDGFIASAGWNRTNRFPTIGDVSEPTWQQLKTFVVSGTMNLIYRLRDRQIEFAREPGNHDVVLPYFSRGWVKDTGGNRRDNLATDDDVVLFEPQLFKAGLKLRFLRENKFDTASAQADFDHRLASAKSRDKTGMIQNIGPRRDGPRFITGDNLPYTGYGS